MHFQHPEVLYALFLLIIPVIIHLFRLRKFQKEDFTNVKFLKKVIQETRKSSRLKKFLVLFTRILLFTSLILAFAQPYIPATTQALQDKKTLIYLDNSFSMEASSSQRSLFSSGLNQLLENLSDDESYALLTNDREISEFSGNELKDVLQNITLTYNHADFRNIQLKAKNYFKDFPGTVHKLLMISDFQQSMEMPDLISTDDMEYALVQGKPSNLRNRSIDSAYITEINPENFKLNINLSSTVNGEDLLAVSVFDEDKLLGRNTVDFSKSKSTSLTFTLQNKEIAKGRIKIDDPGLQYDNQLFFNIRENPAIKVVIISEADNGFLQKIFTNPEFETLAFSPTQIDFNSLNSANLIILNEVQQFSASLLNNLETVFQNGASLIIIPSTNAQNQNQLLNRFGFSSFSEEINQERLITSIQFDHPLLNGVFEDRTQNFDYPKVLSSFNISSGNAILSYQDNRPFLIGSNSGYLFTAALNRENSDFINSPLVVPVFYQIGLESLKKNQLYYETNTPNSIDVSAEAGKDEVLHLVKNGKNLIPQQQNFTNRVQINTSNLDLEDGNYDLMNRERKILTLSFNYNREESELLYSDISAIENIQTFDSIEEYFSTANAASEITVLWKWFVIFALIFLAIEMLLLKFFK